MRSAAIVLATAVASPVHADNALEAHVDAEAERTWLEVDPLVATQLEGLAVAERRTQRDVIVIDPRTTISLSLDEWANNDRATGSTDLRGQGWRAAARLSRVLGGGVRLDVSATLGDLDTPIGRGRYVDVGVSLLRMFRLSRWRTAYIGLTIGRRRWLGAGPPPPGEDKTGTQMMLVIGTTFR